MTLRKIDRARIPASSTKTIGITLRRRLASSPSTIYCSQGPTMKTTLLRLTAGLGLALVVFGPLGRGQDTGKEADQGVFDQLAAVTGSVATASVTPGTVTAGTVTAGTITAGTATPGTATPGTATSGTAATGNIVT